MAYGLSNGHMNDVVSRTSVEPGQNLYTSNIYIF